MRIDTRNLEGSVDYLGDNQELMSRELNPVIQQAPDLPEDTQLWGILQNASGGSWGGCVYDAGALRG